MPVSEFAEIRALIESWARAVQTRDIEAVVANHSSDMVMFDVPEPVRIDGVDAYRDTWPPFFEWQREGDGTFEITSLEVTAGETTAFAIAILRCGSKEELEQDNRPRLRLTIGLKKVEGRWLIAHEHHSFPAEDKS